MQNIITDKNKNVFNHKKIILLVAQYTSTMAISLWSILGSKNGYVSLQSNKSIQHYVFVGSSLVVTTFHGNIKYTFG